MVPESAETATEEVLNEAIHASEVAGDVDLASTLDPLRDSIANEDDDILDIDDATSGTADHVGKAQEVTVFGQKIRKSKKVGAKGPSQMWLWLPIKFKPVPEKGDFDVKRLKDSVYFFS